MVHGDSAGDLNIGTIYSLFSANNLRIREQMSSLVNQPDSYGNTPLHYAKPYPSNQVVLFLLGEGAKIDLNQQGALNLVPRTLEEYFYDHCIKTAEGGDIDDEEFTITVNFKLFEKPVYDKRGKSIFTKSQAKKGL